MLPESWVLVLVERRPVEAPQREVVLGKVRRHPVQDHADALLMQHVHEEAEIIGGAVS